jgi:hypothetical protein
MHDGKPHPPTMEARVADRVWSSEEMIALRGAIVWTLALKFEPLMATYLH